MADDRPKLDWRPKDQGSTAAERSTMVDDGSRCPASLTTVTVPDGTFKPDDRLMGPRDFRMVAALPFLTALAWVCPDRLCHSLCRSASRLLYRLRPGRYGEFARIFRAYLTDNGSGPPLDDLLVETAALHHLERLQLLRYHRPGSWQPKIRVTGVDHLEQALSLGNGAILWVTFSIFSDMIAKIAMRQKGYNVWHLSRHNHGHISSTRFGIRFLNPIRISLERRHLAARVVIDRKDPRAALRRLEELLADNQVVSITVGAEAQRLTFAPFGPGNLALAGGAPNLALKSGAPLLPVFAERCPDGSFLVTIEPALQVPPKADRVQRIGALIAQECALLYRHFQRLPVQFHLADLHHDRELYEAAVKRQGHHG